MSVTTSTVTATAATTVTVVSGGYGIGDIIVVTKHYPVYPTLFCFDTDAAKKKTHHAHLIQRHIRSRRPDRTTRFKSKAHVWSTPAGAPRRYL